MKCGGYLPMGAANDDGPVADEIDLAAATPHAAPVIKWVGGKGRLLPELLARMPEKIGRYFEPFAGGAALFFRLAPPRAVLSDINTDLIQCYRAIAYNAQDVVCAPRGAS